MLSLKSASTSQMAASKMCLLDLPPEVLKSILDHICNFDDLLLASLVSKDLRNAVLPILYGSINVTFTTRIHRNGETILDFLSKNPHLQNHVREVIIREPLSGCATQELEFSKFRRMSMDLENLCELRICTLDDLALWVLALPVAQKETIRIKIGNPFPEFVPNYKHQLYLQRLRNDQAIALTFRFHYASFREYVGPGGLHLLRPAELGSAIGRFYALRSLSVVIEADEVIGKTQRLESGLTILEADSALPALQELHLELPVQEYQEMDEATNLFLAIVPWSRLQRLSLTGIALIEEVLQAVCNSLDSLSSLRLKAMTLWSLSSQRSRPVHQFHYANAGVWFASRKTIAQTSLFLEGHPLKELMLEGFGMDLSLPRILYPKLRRLKLHLCELLPASLRVRALQAADLHIVARQAPNVELLELDIGQIGNLWHSTAVPGVDVDVRIYQVLDALTALPHLKRLRLFPQYREIVHTSERRLAQPLTEDAAVRLFRKLKEKSASLETLAISSDNHVARYISDFDPMSWELRAAGEKIILTVRQANHDYEQRQVWVGERRLTTEIRRFSYKKPYIPEFEGWIMEC